VRGSHSRFFDLWSRFYERTPFLRGVLFRIQDEAVRRLAAQRGERVLDLGCGPGRGTGQVAAAGARAVGCDLSAGMLQNARAAVAGAAFARGDAVRLPFRAGAFDAAICTTSFHHYPDGRAALRELRRVLRSGGRLVLADTSGERLGSRMVVKVGEGMLFGLDVHVYSAGEWRRMAQEAGFKRVRVEHGRGPMQRQAVFVHADA
jgi:ubiquinone/menaquinone biosynthesis C-methylase UbiE